MVAHTSISTWKVKAGTPQDQPTSRNNKKGSLYMWVDLGRKNNSIFFWFLSKYGAFYLQIVYSPTNALLPFPLNISSCYFLLLLPVPATAVPFSCVHKPDAPCLSAITHCFLHTSFPDHQMGLFPSFVSKLWYHFHSHFLEPKLTYISSFIRTVGLKNDCMCVHEPRCAWRLENNFYETGSSSFWMVPEIQPGHLACTARGFSPLVTSPVYDFLLLSTSLPDFVFWESRPTGVQLYCCCFERGSH